MPITLNVTNDSTGEILWVGPRDLFIQHNKDGLTVHDAIALNELEPGRTLMLGGGAAPLLKVEAEERLPLTVSDMYQFLRFMSYGAPVEYDEDDGSVVAGYESRERELRVSWSVTDHERVGWVWETRFYGDDGPGEFNGGGLESVEQLRKLMLWVDSIGQ